MVGLIRGSFAQIYVGDKYVGYLGELHPVTAKAYDFIFEASCSFRNGFRLLLPLFARTSDFKSDISKFPAVTRDIAFTVKEDVTCEMFEEAIAKFQRKEEFKISENLRCVPGKISKLVKNQWHLLFHFSL